MTMQDDIKPVLTDDRIAEIARSLRWQTQYAEIRENALELGRAVEREVRRVLADREGRQDAIDANRWHKIVRHNVVLTGCMAQTGLMPPLPGNRERYEQYVDALPALPKGDAS